MRFLSRAILWFTIAVLKIVCATKQGVVGRGLQNNPCSAILLQSLQPAIAAAQDMGAWAVFLQGVPDQIMAMVSRCNDIISNPEGAALCSEHALKILSLPMTLLNVDLSEFVECIAQEQILSDPCAVLLAEKVEESFAVAQLFGARRQNVQNQVASIFKQVRVCSASNANRQDAVVCSQRAMESLIDEDGHLNMLTSSLAEIVNCAVNEQLPVFANQVEELQVGESNVLPIDGHCQNIGVKRIGQVLSKEKGLERFSTGRRSEVVALVQEISSAVSSCSLEASSIQADACSQQALAQIKLAMSEFELGPVASILNEIVGCIFEEQVPVFVAELGLLEDVSLPPSQFPTQAPTRNPTPPPTPAPSTRPSLRASLLPSTTPSMMPSGSPSFSPSLHPSKVPTMIPSATPSVSPSELPSVNPSKLPSMNPSSGPSKSPSRYPSRLPSTTPTGRPSDTPSKRPTSSPTTDPSIIPSTGPTGPRFFRQAKCTGAPNEKFLYEREVCGDFILPSLEEENGVYDVPFCGSIISLLQSPNFLETLSAIPLNDFDTSEVTVLNILRQVNVDERTFITCMIAVLTCDGTQANAAAISSEIVSTYNACWLQRLFSRTGSNSCFTDSMEDLIVEASKEGGKRRRDLSMQGIRKKPESRYLNDANVCRPGSLQSEEKSECSYVPVCDVPVIQP